MKNNLEILTNEENIFRTGAEMHSVMYNGKEYEFFLTARKNVMHLISNEPIDDTSYKYDEKYITEKDFSKFKEYTKKQLYALYDGEIYPVYAEFNGLKIFWLVGITDVEEAKKRGFTIDPRECPFPYLEVMRKDVQQLYIKKSVVENPEYISEKEKQNVK